MQIGSTIYTRRIASIKDGFEAYQEIGSGRVFRLADAATGCLDYCFLDEFNTYGARARWYGFMGKIEDLQIVE